MSTTSEENDKRMVGARVDPELHQRVRIAAARNDMSMADYIRNMLDRETDEL